MSNAPCAEFTVIRVSRISHHFVLAFSCSYCNILTQYHGSSWQAKWDSHTIKHTQGGSRPFIWWPYICSSLDNGSGILTMVFHWWHCLSSTFCVFHVSEPITTQTGCHYEPQTSYAAGYLLYLSHDMRKYVFAICEQQRRRSACYIRNFKPLSSFCGCAGRFMSYLVANPKDRFSRDEAHLRKCEREPHMSRSMTKPTNWDVCTAKTQISLGVQSEYSLCAQKVAKDPTFLPVDSEDADQTGRMLGAQVILLVLSCCGPYIVTSMKNVVLCLPSLIRVFAVRSVGS